MLLWQMLKENLRCGVFECRVLVQLTLLFLPNRTELLQQLLPFVVFSVSFVVFSMLVTVSFVKLDSSPCRQMLTLLVSGGNAALNASFKCKVEDVYSLCNPQT